MATTLPPCAGVPATRGVRGGVEAEASADAVTTRTASWENRFIMMTFSVSCVAFA
jgi:hypothetical protein